MAVRITAARLFCTLLAMLLAGCATRLSVETATGESARLAFRVLDARLPAALLYWKESPWHIETLLRLEPALPGCSEVRIYANRFPAAPAALADRETDVQPLQFASTAEELAAWDLLAGHDCALLVSVGSITQDDFTGVSISLPGRVIRRHSMGLQEDLDAKQRWWGMVPIAAVYDITHIPLYYAVGLIGHSAPDPAEPVTVIFRFPDGSSKSADLDYRETRTLLKATWPDVLAMPFDRKLVRTWTRAALARLRLEFTEEAGGELVQDEWLPDSLSLKMIEGHTGNWVYRLDAASESSSDLTRWMGDASSIRFELTAPAGQP